MNTVGSGDQQWNDTFQQVSGVSNSGFPGSSNTLRSLSGQILGGRRRRRRGGNLLQGVVSEAAVPLSLLAMQQSYKGKRRGGNSMVAEAAVPLSLLALQQNYGKRASSPKFTRKFRERGGSASLFMDALPPAALIAMQQSYGKRSSSKQSRRTRRRSRRYR